MNKDIIDLADIKKHIDIYEMEENNEEHNIHMDADAFQHIA